jgi:hypothetical protein
MIARPPGIPMQTFDVHQEAVRLGNPDLSDIGHNNGQEHHALADALECKARHEWLMANYDRKQYCCPDILREPGRPHEGPCLP